MFYYTIKNKEGKYLFTDSHFIHWNNMPNVHFFDTKEKAKELINYFNEQEYNPLEDEFPLEICGFDVTWILTSRIIIPDKSTKK